MPEFSKSRASAELAEAVDGVLFFFDFDQPGRWEYTSDPGGHTWTWVFDNGAFKDAIFFGVCDSEDDLFDVRFEYPGYVHEMDGIDRSVVLRLLTATRDFFNG